jgi:putative transposase
MEPNLPCRPAAWQASDMRIQNLNHSTYKVQYHIVWGTKYRKKWLKDYVKEELINSLYETIAKYPTLWIESINTHKDHVHLQIEIPPNIAVSDAVQKLKSRASIHLRKKFKFIREIYMEKDGIWGVGYFVSTVGINEKQIKQYIEWQNKREVPQTLTLFDALDENELNSHEKK